MLKDDVAPSIKEVFWPAVVFVGSSIASIASVLFSADTWITFATMAGGFLSLARAIQIAYLIYVASKQPTLEEQLKKTTDALMEHSEEDEKLQKLADRAAKEAALISASHTKARKYPPVKKFDE